MFRRPFACALALSVSSALALGACGGSSKGSSQGSTATTTAQVAGAASTIPGGELQIVAKSFSFDPEKITVKAGDKPTLVLTAKDLTHDFTVKELGIHVAADLGKTVTKAVSFDKPGTYTFYCSIAGHREAGMQGTLVVQ